MATAEYETRKMQRMAEDAARITATNRWPRDPLPMKSQPWAMKDHNLRTGVVYSRDLLTIHLYEGGTIPYASMTALVEEWSVD